MVKALYGTKPEGMADIDWKELEAKAVATIWLCLGDDVMHHVMYEESPAPVWLKLKSRYMSKSLTNKLYLKQRLHEDGGGLEFEPTHQHVQSDNRRFEEG
jgi:hypothetical protein